MEELKTIQKAIDSLKARFASGVCSPQPNCSSCRWFEPWTNVPDSLGYCHKGHPRIFYGVRNRKGRFSGKHLRWPQTSGDEFCKEHDPK